MTDADEIEQLSALVGEPVVAAERCGWGFENRTDKVTLSGGRTLIVQRIANEGMAAHKIRLAQLLPERLAEVGLRAPRQLHANAHTNPPYAVREYLEGQAGASRMSTVEGAVSIASAMGALLPCLANIRTEGLGLHTGWASPARLVAQALAQLARRRALIADAHAAVLEATIGRVETLFADRPVVFAHGDFCPVNVLIEPGELGLGARDVDQVPSPEPQAPQIVALLDVEFARVADPLFDAAWWSWVVRYHHEERWRVAFPRLLAAAGIASNEETLARIQAIQQLRLLEALDYNAGLGAERAAIWAERLATTIGWE